MTVMFKDEQGQFMVTGVENIYHDLSRNCWNVLFQNGDGEEYFNAELIEIGI